MPTHQLFYYDAVEVLPALNVKETLLPLLEKMKDDPADKVEKAFNDEIVVKEVHTLPLKNDRNDGLRIVVGQKLMEKLQFTRLFMIGAGAIGCELLKNYAMLGVGTGKGDEKAGKKGGSIVLTDPDVIEVSNLNRQFLFREKHLRKPKSSTAAAAAIQMNKELKGNVVARLDKVHDGTRHIFTDQFFEELTVVTNALDNIAARKYVDLRCVSAKVPLLESGTLGPKGHVQVIIPYQTESYGSMQDPEDNNEIPHCTLKMFPEETLHCVEWARDLFGKLFTTTPKSAVKILEEGPNFTPISQQDVTAYREGVELLADRPKSFDDCVAYARLQFEKYFSHDIQQLLHVYPLDAKTKEGQLFWTLPKRPPTPMVFDAANTLHQQLIASMACLRATIFKIKIPSDKPRTDEFRKQLAEQAAKVEVPAFKADEAAAKEIQANVDKGDEKEEKKDEEKKEAEEAEPEVSVDEVAELKKKFVEIYEQVGKKEKDKKYEDTVIAGEEFEKDEDSNFHIDFMAAMGNCRAQNYKLEPMDWIQVKLKAGRIVPAMATTTAAIAGLQALELVKVVKECKKVDYRNAFLNLAAPFYQASEPGDLAKTKLVEGVEVTLWDTWTVDAKGLSLKEVMEAVETKYKGIEIRDVMCGNKPLFFSAIMNAAGKEKEREAVLK